MNAPLFPPRPTVMLRATLRALSLVLLVHTLTMAQEEPSRLRYTAPKDWKPAGDGKSLIPPGPNVAVTFGPSTPFAGTPEEWLDQSWRPLAKELKLVSAPASTTHGRFLVRIGMFQQPDGSSAWLCLNTLVQDGRGEAVAFVAGSEAQFRELLPALSEMLSRATIASSAAGAVVGSGATAPGAKVPAPRKPQNATGAAPTLDDYEFIPPAQWQVQKKPDQIILTQSPDMLGCYIQILPPQPSSGDLEKDARAVFEMMYPGWGYTKTGEQQHVLAKGILPRGLPYCMKEAQMSMTGADGRYQLEDGTALVVGMGNQVALIAVRHRGLLAHVDCLNKYETWRRFFNSFTTKNVPAAATREADPATRLVGAWAQSQSRAMSEYVFAANGRYAFSGAIGTSRTTTDMNYEYLHLKTYAFEGDGTYAISGDMLTLTKHRGGTAGQVRFRFEQANHGGSGWKDRLWLLTKDKAGEVEVCYEKRTR